MPRVLLLFPVHDIGGGETVLLNLARFRRNPDVSYEALLVADEDGPLGEELTRREIPWARVPRGRMRNPAALLRAVSLARGEIRRRRPDVILTNSSQGLLYGRLAARGLEVSAALYFMSVPDPKLWRNGWLDIAARAARPEMVFAASNRIRRALEGWGLAGVKTVYHGAPEPSSDEDPAFIRRLESLGIRSANPVVIMPGRLQPWKGQRVFLEAFAGVVRRFPEARGVVLGGALFGRDGGYRERLLEDAKALKIEAQVLFPGQESMAPWLKRADGVVHASLGPDAFPNVCIEALAARRPLITNAVSGVAEILIHRENAWVVPPGDPDALGSAIVDLLYDAGAAKRIADRGYETYRAHCTPAHMVEPIEEKLCALSQPRQRAA